MLPDIQTHGVLLKYLPILEVTHTHTHTQAGVKLSFKVKPSKEVDIHAAITEGEVFF